MKTQIKKKMKKDIAILHFSGNLFGNPDSAEQLPNEVKKIIDDGIKKVVFDFKNVKLMNSNGMGILIRSYRTLKSADADLKLSCLNEKINGVMDITKMNTVFEIYQTIEEAVRNF